MNATFARALAVAAVKHSPSFPKIEEIISSYLDGIKSSAESGKWRYIDNLEYDLIKDRMPSVDRVAASGYIEHYFLSKGFVVRHDSSGIIEISW